MTSRGGVRGGRERLTRAGVPKARQKVGPHSEVGLESGRRELDALKFGKPRRWTRKTANDGGMRDAGAECRRDRHERLTELPEGWPVDNAGVAPGRVHRLHCGLQLKPAGSTEGDCRRMPQVGFAACD